MTDLLTNVVQKPRATSKGPCDLPIVYRDGSWCGGFFRVDLERAASVLEGTDLEPMPILGKALCTIQAWQYRDSSVGRYNEVGVGMQTRRRGSSPSLMKYAVNQREQPEQGIWVLTLPVTTETAYAAGVEIWGYPKYVAPIDAAFDDRGARVRLADEVSIELPRGRGPETPSVPLVTFTANDGRLVRTVIETDARMRWSTGRRGHIRLLGDGPTSKVLRALGLGEEPRPFAAFQCDRFRAVLPAGEDVGSAKR